MNQLNDLFGMPDLIPQTRLEGEGPPGKLPFTPEMLRSEPSGNLFGLTQNAGMGWSPSAAAGDPYLILSTMGGVRDPEDGTPIALGYHTGHWELDQLVRTAAQEFTRNGVIPFAAFCSDPCDGRSQGTPAMMDSLPYRNDAAIVARRLIRSLPRRKGVLAIATCDKGLPAMMQAVAGLPELPAIIVPGGVTLPAREGEDTAAIQTIGVRYAHQLISLEYAAEMGCRACGSPGGGCQFLGTAATAQVVAEALGLALPFSALIPSGEAIWVDLARRSASALIQLARRQLRTLDILNSRSVENAMLVHAAFGGSTNLLLHVPAIAHAAGLSLPTVDDWIRVNRAVPRLVDALPNGPRNHPTVQVYMAGGVPEVLLHLSDLGLLNRDQRTVTGDTWDEVLTAWKESPQRRRCRRRLKSLAGVDPDRVIIPPAKAVSAGLSPTLVFPRGNLAPEGSVVKATALDPSLMSEEGVYLHRGPARVFTSESDAMAAIKNPEQHQLKPGDVLVLIGIGPSGTGMEEIYQITSALKFLPWGRQIPVLTDGRFSGVSTGACIGHIGPEGLAGGPIGRVRDGDVIEIRIDPNRLLGSINLVGIGSAPLDEDQAQQLLAQRSLHPELRPNPNLPADTRLWALLQSASGGTWKGCVYDLESIETSLQNRSD